MAYKDQWSLASDDEFKRRAQIDQISRFIPHRLPQNIHAIAIVESILHNEQEFTHNPRESFVLNHDPADALID